MIVSSAVHDLKRMMPGRWLMEAQAHIVEAKLFALDIEGIRRIADPCLQHIAGSNKMKNSEDVRSGHRDLEPENLDLKPQRVLH